MGVFDLLGSTTAKTQDDSGKTARRLAAFGVAGLLVVGAAKATRIALEAKSQPFTTKELYSVKQLERASLAK